jgi:adenine-specific DNA-methyltransferase
MLDQALKSKIDQPSSTLLGTQASLPLESVRVEDPHFLKEQLVTYIGNKRSLLPLIQAAVEEVKETLGRMPRVLDAFSGSGAVSRMLKSQASHVISNDLEPYAYALGRCYLSNKDEMPWSRLHSAIASLNATVEAAPSVNGFIERLYAPADDNDIQAGERVFYTRDNARRLDHFSQLIRDQDEGLRPYLLGPLLSAASVHANTAGVFKGFYKDRDTGVGKFGGTGEDALVRIKGTIRLKPPVLSRYKGTFKVLQRDANALPEAVDEVDLAYFDPPYNQHPYGSNYFMLNLLVDYQEPSDISPVSGIPSNWNRSGYNVKKRAEPLLRDLVRRTPARFLLVSFNDEGFVAPESMLEILSEVGFVKEFRTTYNTFRGSRNLQSRNLHVTEHLYLVDRELRADG